MGRVITDKQALALARKRFGKEAFIESRLGAQDADGRAKAREDRARLKAEREAIDAEIKQRLAATEWYVELRARLTAIHKAQDEALGRCFSYRFRVGKVNSVGGLAFAHIEGEGDTWAEALTKAKAIAEEPTE